MIELKDEEEEMHTKERKRCSQQECRDRSHEGKSVKERVDQAGSQKLSESFIHLVSKSNQLNIFESNRIEYLYIPVQYSCSPGLSLV